MSVESCVLDKTRLLRTPLHMMSDKSVIYLFDFVSNELRIDGICHLSNSCTDCTDDFCSTAGITPASTDTILLVLTRTKVGLYSHLELQRISNNRVIIISTFMDVNSQTENIAT